MAETLPSREVPDPDRFRFTIFGGMNKAWGKARAEALGWGRPESRYCESFSEYVKAHEEYVARVVAKKERPAILHGRTNGYRSDDDVEAIDALVLDCDEGGRPDLSRFTGMQFFFQARSNGKFHIVLPLAEPFEGTGLDYATSAREVAIAKLGAVFGVTFDTSTKALSGLLLPYCRHSEEDDTPVMVSDATAKRRFDLVAFVDDERVTPRPRKRNRATATQATAFESELLESFRRAGLAVGGADDKGRPVQCPFWDTHTDPDPEALGSSTMVLGGGYIKCLHAHCAPRLQADHYSRLPLAEGNFAADLQLALEAAKVPRISVAAAQHRIGLRLAEARPHERTATVIRATTGVGKSFSVAGFLDDYCAPVFDEATGDIDPGRSAVLAVPTNALLRELDSTRLRVDRRVRTGVLAVLNDDGTPACRKHAQAKSLQDRGGDVHRLMCARCEHREGCPAREGATRGEGSLTLTNHALQPSITSELRKQGRVPLVVWDESPQMVVVTDLKFSDLTWMLDRFEYEDRPRPVSLDDLLRPKLFGDRYRAVMRPVMSILGMVRACGSIEAAASAYAATRLSDSQLARAQEIVGVALEGTTWERACAAARLARVHNVSEMMFDSMPGEVQAEFLRAAGVERVIAAFVEPDVRFTRTLNGLRGVGLTAAGRQWRDVGGVVLDATAPLDVLRALRPEAVVEELHVEDAGGSTRLIVKNHCLSKTALLGFAPDRRANEVARVAETLQHHVRDLGRKLGRPAKVVVFTYKDFIEMFRDGGVVADDWHWFGDTRGYDGWFQEGFDVFCTIGDPYKNIEVVAAEAAYLGIADDHYATACAEAELAQAHGRARDPQRKLVAGGRLHLHFGRVIPSGWASDNAAVSVV